MDELHLELTKCSTVGCDEISLSQIPGPCFNVIKKTCHSGYRDSHIRDAAIVRPSYLYNGNLDTGK